MSFFTIDRFIRRTEWAYVILNIFDKPISDSALPLSGMSAYWAIDTALSHFFIVETPIPKAK